MKDWVITKIEEIAEVNPRLPKGALSGEIPVSFVPMAAVDAGNGLIDVSDTRPYSAVQKGFTTFKEGDVLFAKITPCMENGKMAVVPKVKNGYGFGSTEFHVLRTFSGIEAGYLYYYVSSKQFRMDAEHNMTGAVGQRRVPTSYLAASEIPLPPLPEQRRIVAKIEELFSELDKGIESFKTARAQLKVYRQALLKHAFEGKLTAAWREENKGKLETADVLLQRIQVERAERYRQQVKEWEKAVKGWEKSGKKGGRPGKPSLPKLMPPLTAEELADLPQLPQGWGWGKFSNTCHESLLGKMLDKEKNKGTLKPYLRNINVRWSSFNLHNLLEMRFEDSEQDRFCLSDGDLVICEGGEPGRCAVWREKLGCEIRIQKALHRVRFTPSINPDYIQKYFELYSSNNKIDKYFTGTTIKHLTGDGLSKIPLPLCTLNEQLEIMQIIDDKLSAADNFDQTITNALQQAETLRQSILKKAFSGQLVAQDLNDEPASKLLARIKAERAGGVGAVREQPLLHSV